MNRLCPSAGCSSLWNDFHKGYIGKKRKKNKKKLKKIKIKMRNR